MEITSPRTPRFGGLRSIVPHLHRHRDHGDKEEPDKRRPSSQPPQSRSPERKGSPAPRALTPQARGPGDAPPLAHQTPPKVREESWASPPKQPQTSGKPPAARPRALSDPSFVLNQPHPPSSPRANTPEVPSSSPMCQSPENLYPLHEHPFFPRHGANVSPPMTPPESPGLKPFFPRHALNPFHFEQLGITSPPPKQKRPTLDVKQMDDYSLQVKYAELTNDVTAWRTIDASNEVQLQWLLDDPLATATRRRKVGDLLKQCEDLKKAIDTSEATLAMVETEMKKRGVPMSPSFPKSPAGDFASRVAYD